MKLVVDIVNRNICICYNEKGSLKFDSFQARFSTEIQQDYSGSGGVLKRSNTNGYDIVYAYMKI